jgi:hypothetical protein
MKRRTFGIAGIDKLQQQNVCHTNLANLKADRILLTIIINNKLNVLGQIPRNGKRNRKNSTQTGKIKSKRKRASMQKKKNYDLKIPLITQMEEQMELFKKNLEVFARKYRKEINKNPEFRKHFNEMCSKIGVDPLVCS